MSTLITALNAFANAWAALLWRASWQGGVALLLVLLISGIAPRIPAHARCWLWRLAFLKLFLAGLLLMPIELPWLPPAVVPSNESRASPLPTAEPPAVNAAPLPANLTNKTAATGLRAEVAASADIPPLNLYSWLLIAWSLGVALCLANLIRQWVRVRLLVARLPPVTDDEVRQAVVEGCRQLRICRVPELRSSSEPGSPCLIGVLRPVIVLPPAITKSCSSGALNAALMHELAHVRRRDLFWNWLPALAETVFFFHPVVWLARREWRMAQEMATDELAVTASQVEAARYAGLLLELVTNCRTTTLCARTFRPHLALGASEAYSQLRRRLAVMQNFQKPTPRRQILIGIAMLVVATSGLVPWKLTAREARAEAPSVADNPPASAQAASQPMSKEAVIQAIGKLGGDIVYDEKSADRKVISVSLHSSKFSDEGMPGLKVLTGLQALTLDATKVTDAGLVHLKEMTSLQALDLNATGITDAGLAHLKGLTKLGQLGLIGTKITDAGLVHLKEMSEMHMLLLGETKVSDAGLVHLKGFAKLRTLALDRTQVTDAGLTQLSGLKELRDLRLNDTQITSTGLKHLKGLSHLQTLVLNSSKVTDAGIEPLQDLAGLQSLWLSDTNVTDAGLEAAKGMTGLTTLVLAKTKITDAGLVHLKGLAKLKKLDLLNNRSLTEAGVSTLKAALPGCEISWDAVPETPTTVAAAPAVDVLMEQFTSAKFAWEQIPVAEKLIALGDKSVIAKFEALLDVPDHQRRCSAALVLAGLGDERGPKILIRELEDQSLRPTEMQRSDGRPNPEGQVAADRHFAALLLGKLRLKQAVQPLIEATKDPTINLTAAISLGEIGDKSAIPAIRQMAADYPKLRIWTSYALAALGEQGSFSILQEVALVAAQWTARRHAVEALEKIGNRAAVPTLIKVLRDKHENVRVSAAIALGKLGDPAALDALKAVLGDTVVTKVNAPTTTAAAAQKAIDLINGKK